jgi:hypothetical protein
MTWSFARARQAAAEVRAAPLGSQAVATMRPRGGVGLVRSRAPLSVLLFVAARDGLVTEQDNGGYAVLQRPAASPPIRSGGYQLRLLRWLDRRWDFVLFGGPPLLGLVAGAVAAPFAATRVLGLVAATAAALWVCAFLCGTLAWQLLWVAGLGASRGQRRAAESLAACHWSVRLHGSHCITGARAGAARPHPGHDGDTRRTGRGACRSSRNWPRRRDRPCR